MSIYDEPALEVACNEKLFVEHDKVLVIFEIGSVV